MFQGGRREGRKEGRRAKWYKSAVLLAAPNELLLNVAFGGFLEYGRFSVECHTTETWHCLRLSFALYNIRNWCESVTDMPRRKTLCSEVIIRVGSIILLRLRRSNHIMESWVFLISLDFLSIRAMLRVSNSLYEGQKCTRQTGKQVNNLQSYRLPTFYISYEFKFFLLNEYLLTLSKSKKYKL